MIATHMLAEMTQYGEGVFDGVIGTALVLAAFVLGYVRGNNKSED